ncbi:MAG: hypothetical protein AB1421_02980 [Pseudomonadota bacterium]
MKGDEGFRIAYCTIASANYLARVQYFVHTLQQNQLGAKVFVLLCEADAVRERITSETGFPFLSPQQILPPDWREMAFQYGIIEFNTAVKPFLMEYILDQGFNGVFYFDPDIAIYSQLGELEEALRTHDVVLTPHACHPVPDDGLSPAMADYLRAGQFNLGFIGMAGSKNGRNMLAWWKSVCRDRCIFDSSYRFFVDQFWAAAFASFAERLYVFRHPGANVAYWNLFQRDISRPGSRWEVDDHPLLFFHFSGLATDNLTRVSRYQNRVTAAVGSPLHQLLTDYVQAIRQQPWGCYGAEPYSFACYCDGTPVAADERRNYLMLSWPDKKKLADPFSSPERVRAIVSISINGDMRSYLARIRLERYIRTAQFLGHELREKLRSRGMVKTMHLAIRFAWRKLMQRF